VDAPIVGDSDLLGRLLLNLLDNAIKHSPPGGVVGVELTVHDRHYDVTVADGGPGIPPDAQERVFDRFFRVDRARSREDTSTSGGAGLGLAIARRIAEAHGGSLDLVRSEPGRTEFRARVPRDPGGVDSGPV
jgi:two-component system OmpR family sensor kinase